MRDTETDATTEGVPVTEHTPTTVTHELWQWLDDEARAALSAGEAPTEAQLDAAADRRRVAQAPPEDNVRYLPAKQVQAPGGGFLSISAGQTSWSDDQVKALISHCNIDPNTPNGEVLAFLHLCQRSGLDPLSNEIYLIGRKEKGGRIKYTAQTGIDGFRTLAERTREYLGKQGPWWCGPDGQWTDVWLSEAPPAAARVTVLRSGRPDTTATVLYREFAPMTKVWEGAGDARRPKRDADGREVEEPAVMWKKMPAHMLAKCAEALAIRQAFPRQASGIYSDEEMDQVDARNRAAAEDEAREERDRQRRELVTRLPSTPGDRAPLGDVAPGEVIEGTVVDEEPVDRDGLWAELEEQARLHATTVQAMTRRWVAANRKNLEDATDAELAALVRERRASTVERAAAEVAASTEVPPPDPDPEIGQERGQDATESDPTPDPPAEPPESEEQRAARREAIEEQARKVAREQRQAQERERRTKKSTPPGQDTP